MNTLFPPIVFCPAEGLRYTVHGLAEEDGDLFVLASVLVFPRADEEQTAFGTEGLPFC